MRRKNKDTGKEYKRGDLPSSEDLFQKAGKVFYTYRDSRLRGTGYVAEEWKTPEKLDSCLKTQKERTERKGKKEINPKTGGLWKRGEICEERGYFWEYMRAVRNDGMQTMIFQKDFSLYHRERIKTIFMKRRIFANKNRLPFNITWQYLHQIFPKDFRCPVLGMKMVWTGTRNGQNNPSLDRKVPDLGYVKGNVAWISYRANQIKNDATIEELEKIIDYSKM
jgi:hypothetical protein